MKIAYPCRIEQEEEAFNFSFRDIPLIGGCGYSYEHALELAEENLNRFIDAELDNGRNIPAPSAPAKNEILIPVLEEFVSKILDK
jgi:predicted RNase H-like HicB family nuclease